MTRGPERLAVVESDPEWPQQFRDISSYLQPFLEPAVLRIEHVGSTSVPGLAAKPIIDIDVVVESDQLIGPTIALIESAGYSWVGDLGVAGREAFDTPPDSTFARHHLYLVVENNRAHSDHWLLREALLSDPDASDAYARVKRANVALSHGDMDRYVALKARFVAEVLARARFERGMEPVAYWDPELD
jgi:GrpB-like predicted nucleotidyltransferase (UPF0157 family)